MKRAIPKDITPYSAPRLPFANETEVQEFVEKYAQKTLGLKVIGSTTPGKRGLFKIDILAIDKANTPFIIECKWDRVGPGAIRQLVRYRQSLLGNWLSFVKRVSKARRRQVVVKPREPVLVAIGYGYEPSVLREAKAQSVICLTYAYHPATLTVNALEEPRSGRVSIQDAPQNLLPTPRHPTVSKKHYTFKKLAPLPPALRTAFWTLDGRLLALDAVRVGHGKLVRYRVPKASFAKAKICPELRSIQWHYRQSGKWRDVKMIAAHEAEKIFDLLRQAHVDVE